MKGIRLIAALVAVLLGLVAASVAFAAPGEGEGSSVAAEAESLPARTADSETLVLPGGRLETRIYPNPVNYRDEEGHWRPIGERLHETGAETLVNGPNDFDVTLPKQIDSQPIRFEVGSQWIESRLLRKDLEGAELEGETATYEGEGNAPSFEFTGLSNGLKEGIELTGPGQATTYSYELAASSGLEPSLIEGGSIAFRDSKGKAVVILPAPVMSDAAGAQSRAVHYELGPEEEGQWKLSVVADPAWLAQPERKFPVVIDPTITIGSPYGCVIGGHKGETGWIDCASWGRETFLAGYTPKLNSAEDNWWRTLMNLETTAIPPTATVSSASFHIHSSEAALNTSGVELRKVTKPWNWEGSWSRYDGTHLWSTEGGDYSESLGEVLTSKRGTGAGWWEFSLPTKAVEEEATEGTELPVIMKLIDDKVRECGKTSCTNRQVTFDSSAAKTEANRPYLSVVYSVPSSETPVAEYSFNEGSGEVAKDASGHGHEGTLHGAKWSSEGHFGGALSFDGKSALVTVPSSKELELSRAFTLEAWVRPEEANPWSAVLVKEVPGWASFELHAEAGGEAPAAFLYDSDEGEAVVEGTSALPTKAWSYLSLTSDGTTVRLYVNGKLAGSAPAVNAAGGKGPLQIGGDALWGEGDAFKGLIDNIRLYNRTLSEAEVKADEGRPVGVKAPTATTEAATGIKAAEATLKGSVNPNGGATTYQFEYGTTTSYGTKVPASPESAGSGTSAVALSKAITGLKEGTTYHFRVVATNEAATVEGEDKTFTTPKLPTVTTEAATGVKETKATLKGSVNPNGSSTTYQFEYGTTTAYGTKAPKTPASIGSGTTALPVSEVVSGLEEGVTYHYRVVASKGAGTAYGSDMTVKTTHPPQTTITSPTPTYTSHEEPPIQFESSQAGSTFKCGLDEGETPTEPCTSPYVLPDHLETGWHTVVVAAVNAEGQADPTPAKYVLNPDIYPPVPAGSEDKLVSPEEGKRSADYFTLKAEWGKAPEGGGVTGVTFQVQLPKWEAFKDVPAECVIDGNGEEVSWPLPASESPGHTEPVFLKVRGCAPFEEAEYPQKEIKFRAVFDGGPGAAGASEPAATEFSYWDDGKEVPTDAVEQIGPVSVDLLTGKISVSRTDVSIPVPGTEANLEFTRTYNSGEYGPSYQLGPQWQPSLPVEQEYEGEAWTKLQEQVIPYHPPVFREECWDEEGEEVNCGTANKPCNEAHFCEEWEYEEAQPEERWIELTDNTGAGISFEIVEEEGKTRYVSPEEAKELLLTRPESSHFVLATPEGTHTVFKENELGAFVPETISFQATPGSSRMVYEHKEHEGLVLVREIAPAPVTCEDTSATKTPGCRTLKFEYRPATEWGFETYSWEQRLASIRYYTATHESGKEENSSQVVAQYDYDSNGRLIEESDPRVPSVPPEEYGYPSESSWSTILTSLTPPGQEPWRFDYYFENYYRGGRTGNPGLRLKSVSRDSLIESEPTATTTLAYDVPLSGEDAPYDMSPKRVAEWGQSDLPVDATAVFPPTQVPSIETFGLRSQIGSHGSGDGQLASPHGLAVDGEGNVWVADTENNRIEEFNSEGEYISQFGSYGSGNGQFSSPHGLAVDGEGNVWVADTENNRIEEFNSEGKYLFQFGSYGTEVGKMNKPTGVAVDAGGVVWVADTANNRVERFSASGKYESDYTSLKEPTGIVTHGPSVIMVADTGNNRIVELADYFELPPTFIGKFGSAGSGDGQLSKPEGIAVDAAGNRWVADTGNDRLEEFKPGIYKPEYASQIGSKGSGEEEFEAPAGLANDSNGSIWIADTGNARVQEWNSDTPPLDDYSQATVHYMDPGGYEVNTASPAPPGVEGDAISTSETDAHGNVVRSLSPQNRLLALAAGSGSVARSEQLDNQSIYSTDGTKMTESLGPLHKVRLESG